MLNESIDTPALLLDMDNLEWNIRAMAKEMRQMGCNLRPHVKGHKTPAIAHRQVAAGAIGVTCAKVSEADVMVASGIDNVLIANQIVTPHKIRRLVGLAREADVTVAVDDFGNAREIARESARRGASVGVIIEVDVGMGRAGVAPGQQVLTLARRLRSLKGIRFRGVMGYEGHLQRIATLTERRTEVKKSMRRLIGSARLLASEGFDVEIVSAAGTNTYSVAGQIEGITEVQAGSYVLMDVMHQVEGVGFKNSLSVLSTVTSRPGARRAITDAGIKAFGQANMLPQAKKEGVTVKALSEEHGWLELRDGREIRIGDGLEFYPYYSPYTVNLYDRFHCTRKGRLEVVWEILARGRSQ